MAIKFNTEYPGFVVGKAYKAKYAMHPLWGYMAVRMVDEDGDTRYIAIDLLNDGTIEEVEEE